MANNIVSIEGAFKKLQTGRVTFKKIERIAIYYH